MRGRQKTFEFRTWGGRRKGAGRPRTLPGKPELPHDTRKPIAKYVPSLVTLRLDRAVPSLRNRAALAGLLEAFGAAKDRLGMRIIHFGIESNHLHLIVEGVNAAAMKGLGVRIARRINRLAKRNGRVIGDRHHARALRSPPQVRDAVVRPRTWLLEHPAPS